MTSPHERHLDASESVPCLYLLLQAGQPFAHPARVSLQGLDDLTVGRGEARVFHPSASDALRTLDVRVEDPAMSRRHARLRRLLGRWILQDEQSKNGCRLNGDPVLEAELSDGDLLEIGHTFFRYREVPLVQGSSPVLDGQSLASQPPGFVTLLPDLSRTFEMLLLVAPESIGVLLEGETGTGKEVLARALHVLSGRPGDFMAVNCGALPRELLESELFGHKKGAFSGALEDRRGLVRAADRGTLFLDEIGDLALPAQAALLRVLQEREVRPVGSTAVFSVDVRVIAATHRPLDRMAQEGQFRLDLLHRLAGHRVQIPPLRDRLEDVGILIRDLLERAGAAASLSIRPQAARALLQHEWPGNIRELQKTLSTAAILSRATGVIELSHLPESVRRAADSGPRSDEQAQRADIASLMRKHHGNIAAVARELGKARMQIQRILKKAGLDPNSFRR